ncbi:MAG: hypothetical protein HYS05_05165, partial [Acidobacteria bacterium]|nr:hypothetical protein [Acidobacteriota bacterium]
PFDVRRVAGIAEHQMYVAILVLTSTAYAYSSFLSSSHPFGFAQLRHLGLIATMVAFVVAPGLAFRCDERLTSHRVAAWTGRLAAVKWLIGLAVMFVIIALPLRNNWINADGRSWPELFRTKGPSVNLDQILELYVHYLFSYTIGKALGWDVTFSYQVLSVVGGAGFLLILGRLSPLLLPGKGVWLFAWVLSGGFMQLFFGDVENYSLVTPLMMLYLWLSILYLKERVPLWAPSLLLAVAASFHLLTVFLGPSWLYLAWLELRRRGMKDVATSCVLASLVLATTFFIVHFAVVGRRVVTIEAMQETVSRLTEWSGGLNPGIWLASRSVDYYYQIANVLMLLVPQALVVVPLLLYRRIDWSRINVFIAISAAMFGVMLAVWYSGLGVPNDWNVFAPMSVTFSIWCGYNFVRIEGLRYKTAILVGLLVVGALHSYSWIVCNHFPTCP